MLLKIQESSSDTKRNNKARLIKCYFTCSCIPQYTKVKAGVKTQQLVFITEGNIQLRAPAIVPLEEKFTMVGDLERFGVSSKHKGSAPFGNRNSAIQSLF